MLLLRMSCGLQDAGMSLAGHGSGLLERQDLVRVNTQQFNRSGDRVRPGTAVGE